MPGPCICSGLSVANCLRQLCPLGTRSLSAQASVCGSRTVGRPEFIRGVQFRPLGRNSLTTFRGQTALRGCPRPRFAALTRRDYCPFWWRGSQCRAQWSGPAFTYGRGALVLAFFRRQNGRAFFHPLPIAARFPHSWRWADLNGDDWNASVCWGDAAAQKNRLGFDSVDGINHTHNGGWNVAT